MGYKNYKIALSIVLLVSILIACSSPSKLKFGIDPLRQQASYVAECGSFTCVNEVCCEVQADLAKQEKRMLQIYLIRHAKTNVKKNLFYSAQEVKQYYQDYNSSPVIAINPDVVSVKLNPNHVIYCSSMSRSQETALSIFGKRYPIVADTTFREFESKVISAKSIVKLPLPLWQLFNRGTWILGFNNRGIENYREAKQRAKRAAENLVKVAKEEETAILVAHGMLSGAISKELKKKGWRQIQKQGHVNLGATILVKIINE